MAPIFRQTKPQRPSDEDERQSSPSRFSSPVTPPQQRPGSDYETSYETPNVTHKPETKRERVADMSSNSTLIGKGQTFNGEISGRGSIRVEGEFIGTIKVEDEVVIGKGGKVEGDIVSKVVTVVGEIKGNVEALEKINIEVDGSMIGDIVAPRVMVEEGAVYKGKIDMEPKGSKKKTEDESKSEGGSGSKTPPKQKEEKDKGKQEQSSVQSNQNSTKVSKPVEGPPPKPGP